MISLRSNIASIPFGFRYSIVCLSACSLLLLVRPVHGYGEAVPTPLQVISVENQLGTLPGGFANAVDLGLYRFDGGPFSGLRLSDLGGAHPPEPRRAIAKVKLGSVPFISSSMSLVVSGDWQLVNGSPGDALILPDGAALTNPTGGSISFTHSFPVTSGNVSIVEAEPFDPMNPQYDVEFLLRYGCMDSGQNCSTCEPFGISNFVSEFPVQFSSFTLVPEPTSSLIGLILPLVFARWKRLDSLSDRTCG